MQSPHVCTVQVQYINRSKQGRPRTELQPATHGSESGDDEEGGEGGEGGDHEGEEAPPPPAATAKKGVQKPLAEVARGRVLQGPAGLLTSKVRGAAALEGL